MKPFSRIISTLFHPLLMPTLGLFLIFHAGSHISFMPIELRRIIYLVVFISSCLLPITLIPLFLMLKLIKSVYMENRRERIMPIFTAGFFYFLGYFLLKRIPSIPPFLESYVLATLIAVYSALIITFFWKISIHMIGIGGLTGGILALSLRFGLDLWVWFSITLVIAGLIGTARLYLKAHSPAQIYTGFATGFFLVFLSILM